MPHYFSERQNGIFEPFDIKIRLRQLEFNVYSASGIFSKREIDKGTKLLIERCILNDGENVLDIGCGNGVVGVAVRKLKDVKVMMVDINERALKLARLNVKRHNLNDVNVKKSDLYKNIEGNFDVILSNPPQTAGKKVCFEIITGAYEHLKRGGSLQLVARHKKGGAELEKKMKEVFSNVEQIAKGSGFRVYMSKKK